MIREREYNEFGEFLNDVKEKQNGEYTIDKIFMYIKNTKEENIINSQLILSTLSLDNKKYSIYSEALQVDINSGQDSVKQHFDKVEAQRLYLIERIKDSFNGKINIINGIERVRL